MTWRLVFTMSLVLSVSGCARGVSQPKLLPDAGGGSDRQDSGADGDLDAMTMRDAGSKDGGKSNGKDSGAGTDAGMTGACALMNMCSSARVIPEVAGDTGSEIETTAGMRSEWLSVAVTDTGGITPTYNATKDLRARLTLTSNDGANYDLFLVRPPDSATGNPSPISDCGAAPVSSELASGVDSVSTFWPDKANAPLGEEAGDAFTLSIEVRHVSGPCGSWTLTVEGNK